VKVGGNSWGTLCGNTVFAPNRHHIVDSGQSVPHSVGETVGDDDVPDAMATAVEPA